MIPNPGQFEKSKPCATCGGSGKHPAPKNPRPVQGVLPGMGRDPKEEADEKRKRQEMNKHEYIGGPKYKYPKPKGDGLPNNGSDHKRRSEDHRHESYMRNVTKKDLNKKNPKKPPNDDDKGNAGGASIPRKPKPKGPQFPARVIERKTDQDYARKLDRYRVQAR